MLVHKRARDAYHARFQELESIVTTPYDFALSVKAIGNQINQATISQKLYWLPNKTKISITVAISHHASDDLALPDKQWAKVILLCDEIIILEDAKNKLLEFLEGQMYVIAPNTAALVGASVCAKLIAAAGSLVDLSRTPACNI